jgi:selenide,water dikinase
LLHDPRLLVGHDTSDDAAAYQLAPDLVLVQTVDFFTPVVDDPFLFGQIAAANALSDIYAMGARPLLALNIVGFPSCLGEDVLREILRGGAEKVKEAGALLAGGHSINDEEPKYGLAVTGTARPEEIWSNGGARPGDDLILTKPLGTGVFLTAYKVDLAPLDEFDRVATSMATLNAAAAAAARKIGVSACTDITGFGLLGHAYEMAKASNVDIIFYLSEIPFFPGARDLARQGLVPAGTYRNREYLAGKVELPPGLEDDVSDLLFDPQTSGGLLFAVSADRSSLLLEELSRSGIHAARVGRVEEVRGLEPRLVVVH